MTYLATLIPSAEAGGEFKTLPTQEHFSLREIPPTEVGGVSKFNLRSVRRVNAHQSRLSLETHPTGVGGISNQGEHFL